MDEDPNAPSNMPSNVPEPSWKNFTWFKIGGLVLLLLVVFGLVSSHNKKNISSVSQSSLTNQVAPTQAPQAPTAPADPKACNVAKLEKNPTGGIKVYSPKGGEYVVNKEDAGGVQQIYIGKAGSSELTCITCYQVPNGPKPERSKMQPSWYPSGDWIFLAVERDQYSVPAFFSGNKSYIEGQLQNGIWTDMWAVSPDGKTWYRMTNFESGVPGVGDGFTGPAFTPDGKKAIWSQAMDGNIFAYYPFGRWELTEADVSIQNGKPLFSNEKNITPAGMNWNEPGNFSPDDQTLVLTGSTEKDAEGMDQYLLNIKTGKLTNLTNSPTIWDEHGVFSPDGKKILFMSAYPYRDDPNASKVLSIKTDFMLVNSDGSNFRQLTYFRTPGHAEYSNGIAAVGAWSPDGRSIGLRQLVFPNYQDWQLTFAGVCGNN